MSKNAPNHLTRQLVLTGDGPVTDFGGDRGFKVTAMRKQSLPERRQVSFVMRVTLRRAYSAIEA